MKQIEKGYYIKKSSRKNKKYDIFEMYEPNKYRYLLSFGDNRYQQFKDRTPLKLYSNLDHKDQTRRRLYFSRHKESKNKLTARYWSNKYLW